MKQVELSQDSWHFKIYSKFISSEKPKSLCPYFWTWVAMLLLAPFVLVMSPLVVIISKVLDYLDERESKLSYEEWKAKHDKKQVWWNKFWKVVGNIIKKIVIYGVIPAAAVVLFYTLYKNVGVIDWYKVLLAIGAGLGVVATVILLVQGIAIIHVKFYNSHIKPFLKAVNPVNWKVTKLIGTMIVATYKKACPIIIWK